MVQPKPGIQADTCPPTNAVVVLAIPASKNSDRVPLTATRLIPSDRGWDGGLELFIILANRLRQEEGKDDADEVEQRRDDRGSNPHLERRTSTQQRCQCGKTRSDHPTTDVSKTLTRSS